MQLMRYTFFIIFFQIGQNRIIYWLSMNYVTFMLQKLGILSSAPKKFIDINLVTL